MALMNAQETEQVLSLPEGLEQANSLINENRIEEAVHLLEELTVKHPNAPDLYALLANLYLAQEKTDIPKEWILKAVGNTPSIGMTMRHLALRLYKEERYKESDRILESLVWGDPNDFAAWNDLGVVRLAMDDMVTAERAFIQSLALNPGYGEALLNLTTLYLETERHDLAVFTVETALQDPRCDAKPEIFKSLSELIADIAPEEADRLLAKA